MKKIIFFKENILVDGISSGISIRLKEIDKWFCEKGHKTKFTENTSRQVFSERGFFYTLISTHENSLGSKVIKNIPGDKKLIIDLYTPILLEKKINLSKFNIRHLLILKSKENVVKTFLKRGNHFLVANSRQKKYWMGIFRKMNIKIKSSDISVIPTGSPLMAREKLPFEKRKIILWFGGVYPWLNPNPLIDAFSQIALLNPTFKLRILGGLHNKTGYSSLFQKVLRRAEKKIATGQLELINWQEFIMLHHFLKDVYFAVHIPKHSAEDYYAHRVRLLTLLNDKIPIVTAGNDLISALLLKNKAGVRVKEDAESFKKILNLLIQNPSKVKKYSASAGKIETLFIRKELQDKNLLTFLENE